MTKTTKTTQPDRYLLLTEDRSSWSGERFYHLTVRVTEQRYDAERGGFLPYGPDDTYGAGPLYSGLRVTCQGDDQSRRRTIDEAQRDQSSPVYGFDVEYHDVHSVDRRKAERMHKTLTKLERTLDKLQETRGYPRTYGEYVGRIAEALGCTGIGAKHVNREDRYARERWDWRTIGDGVRHIDRLIEAWVDEARPAKVDEPAAAEEAAS